MIVLTKDLKGLALDWAVAKCQGAHRAYLMAQDFIEYHNDGKFQFSIEWAKGGPIIERERIWLSYDDGVLTANMDYVESITGDDILTAAMRCYVASKLGTEVDVPEELIQ